LTARPVIFLFIRAGVSHRLEDFTGDLTTLRVIFYAPEGGEAA
jgi:hypothetical protein